MKHVTEHELMVPGCRRVETSDHRFVISFPLPPAHNTVRTPTGRHLDTVRRSVNELLNQGYAVRCPITGALVKIYRRGLHQGQVATLRRLRDKAKLLGAKWLHIQFFTSRRDGDFAKMQHWGLIDPMPEHEASNGQDHRGSWRITAKGLCWLHRDLRIPRQMAILNGECLGAVDESDLISPDDVPDHFSRDDLDAGKDGMVPQGTSPIPCP